MEIQDVMTIRGKPDSPVFVEIVVVGLVVVIVGRLAPNA